MPKQFTGDARQVVVCASEQARRLGHGFIGGEHLLYGLASGDGEVGAVLRERGVTPERVEAEFVRLIGPENTASGSLFDTLDRDALTTIGIDLDTVRERIEAAFGPAALAPDAPAPRRWRRSRPGRGPVASPDTSRSPAERRNALRGRSARHKRTPAAISVQSTSPSHSLQWMTACLTASCRSSAPRHRGWVPRSAPATDRPADAGYTARRPTTRPAALRHHRRRCQDDRRWDRRGSPPINCCAQDPRSSRSDYGNQSGRRLAAAPASLR